jgi:hypothetical protein
VRPTVVPALVLAAVMAGCGGSGDDEAREASARSSTTAVTSSTTTTVTTIAASTTSTPAGGTGTTRSSGATTALPPTASPPTTAAPYPGRRAGTADPRVRVSLALAGATVARGLDLSGTLTVENTSGDTVDVTHPSACATDAALYRDGQPVSEGFACAQVVTPHSLGPHETATWDVSFPARDGNGAPLAAGEYVAAAGLDVSGRGVWYAPGRPVTVT